MKHSLHCYGALLVALLLFATDLPVMAGTDRDCGPYPFYGDGWSASFEVKFDEDKNLSYTYSWWTGEGARDMAFRLKHVDIARNATCTGEFPGFDVKLGVSAVQKKGMEYRNTEFDYYLVKDNGYELLVGHGYFNTGDTENFQLDNKSGAGLIQLSHPVLYRTGSKDTEYEHKINTRVSLSQDAYNQGYKHLRVKGRSKYYKDPTWHTDVIIYVWFNYYIELKEPAYETFPEPEYAWKSPTELTITLRGDKLPKVNSSQMEDTNGSTRLGMRNNGVTQSSVKSNLTVELWDEAETNLLNKHAFDVDGYESRSFTFNVPKNQSYKVKVTSKSDYKVTVKSAYYRSREWSEGKRTLTNSSKEKSYVKSFNNQGVSLQFTFNQVKGNTTLSWPRDLNLPKDATMYIYRTILNEDGSYAGNREELGYTTKNTFQDNADRGMELGKKYRYEIVALSKEWIDNGFKVPADPESLPDCNSAECFVNTSPILPIHLTQDMNEVEKIKIGWDFQGIPEKETDLNFRIHRLGSDGTEEMNYGSVTARRKDGHADFIDDKPASNCEVYKYYVQLDLIDNKLHYFSDTLTARITASTSITHVEVSKGTASDGIHLTWNANQVGANPTTYLVKRRFVGSKEWSTIYTTKGTADEYTFLDVESEPGRYYEYCVEAYGANCEGSDELLLTDSRIEPGFGQASGTITGRVSFDTGTAVDNVKVNLLRSDDEANGNVQFYSRQILQDGGGVAWKTTADKVKEVIGAQNDWSLQMWVKPDDIQTTDMILLADVADILKLGLQKGNDTDADYSLVWHDSNQGAALTICDSIPADEYSQVTFIHNSDTLLAYVNGKLRGTTILQAKENVYESLSGDVSVNFCGDNFTGFVDEVRLWNKALSEKEVGSTWGRIISGREDGLKLYWPFDEGLDEYAFDFSRTGGVANSNHPSVGFSQLSNVIPTSTQLGLYGVTNESGEYVIRGIPFTGSGTGYTVQPELGVHEFSPQTRNGFISASSMSLNHYDFTDVSSFKVSGVVYYAGTDVPVDSVMFAVDGTTCMAEGKIIYTNANGEYTISVPIGFHRINASRGGHTFANEGRYPSAPGTTYEFRKEETINFTDNTLAHFGGRITGSSIEGIKPLGYGVSKNTIGQATLQLEAIDYPQCRLNVVTRNNGLVTEIVNNPENVPVESFTEFVESESWRAGGDANAMRYIYVKTDPKTGEFSAMLPPLRYRVSSVTFEHNPSLNEEGIFHDLSVVDLSDVQKTETCDTLWNAGHMSYQEPLFKCHGELILTYRSPVEFDVHQIGADNYFGAETVTVSVMGEKDVQVPVIETAMDGQVKYLYGYPFFEQNEKYDFKVRVFEPYMNYDDDEEGRLYEAALKDSIVTFSNEMGDQVYVAAEDVDSLSVKMGDVVKLEVNQLRLDSLGTAVYKWKAGFPNLTAPYTRTMNVSTCIDGRIYAWRSEPLEGVVCGAITTGSNFVTAGPTQLLMVLRDPPGANSSTSWERDTIKVTSNDRPWVVGGNQKLAWNFGSRMKKSIYEGLGIITRVGAVKKTWEMEVGEESSHYGLLGDGESVTLTASDKVSTNGSPYFVGSQGDVYIGYAQNYLFGGAKIVGLHKQEDGTYALGLEEGLSVGEDFLTGFRYTQKYIEDNLIPNLKKLRNQLLTHVDDVSQIPEKVDKLSFYTTLKPDDPKYGSANSDASVWGAQAADKYQTAAGPSYYIRVPDKFEGVDSVGFYNNSIAGWIECMRLNEEDKVVAFQNDKPTNYSWDRGTTLNRSFGQTDKEWEYNGYDQTVNVFANLKYGAAAGAAGASGFVFQKTSFGFHSHKTWKETHTDQYNESFSYTLNDNGRNTAMSVDVYKSPRNWGPIFRTRGGQTYCPYEGEEKTKYYKPVTTLNNATMSLFNPKVRIPNNVIKGVPAGRVATVDIEFSNEADVPGLVVLPGFNRTNSAVTGDGLIIAINGTPLGSSGVTLPIFPVGENDPVKMKLTCLQADPNILNYEVSVGVMSECVIGTVLDQASFTLQFDPAAPEADVVVNKTVINQSDIEGNEDKYLTVTARDIDRRFNGFKSVRVKYRFIGDNIWTTAHEFFTDIKHVEGGQLQSDQSVMDPEASSVSHSFALPLIDGHYMVCVETICDGGVTWQSDEIEVVKDTHGPRLLGQAYPNTGILTPTDDIYVRLNEPIRTDYLTREKNFTIVGNLSEAPIDHMVSLQLNGNGVKSDSYLTVSNTSFAASMWLYRESGGTIFEHGSANNTMALSVNEEGRATLTLNGQQLAGGTDCIPANVWVFVAISYEHSATSNLLTVEVSTDSETLKLFDHVPVPVYNNRGNFTVGQGLHGAIHELAVWSTNRTTMQLREHMHKTLPTFMDGLYSYWPMNEGHGTVVNDVARGHNIYLEQEAWNLNNKNLAAHLDGTSYIKADVSTEAVSDQEDYCLSMWFKGDKDVNAGASLVSLTDRMSIDFNETQALVLRTYRGESSLNTNGNTTVLSNVNYNDGEWHHIALNVRRGISANFFIDGQAVKTIREAEVPAFATSNLFIGAREVIVDNEVKPGCFFKGDVDEFAVWRATIDATTVAQSRYVQNDSINKMLYVYYPMEHKYKDDAGNAHTEFSLDSGKKSTNGQLRKAEGEGVTQSLTAPPLKTIAILQNLTFDFTASEDEIYINLKTLPSRMQGNLVTFYIHDVPDVNGNLSEPIMWTAKVDYSTLAWEPSELYYNHKEREEELEVTAKLVNTSADNCGWVLTSLPAWVSVSKKEGSLGIGESENITFRFGPNAPLGENAIVVYAKSDNDIYEALPIHLTVTGNEPAWTVDAQKYESSMNLIGQIYIRDKIASQANTKLYAFVGNECRGVASPVLMPSRDAYFTNLVVYGNQDKDRGKDITFRIYDSNKGVVYADVFTSIKGEEQNVTFSNDQFIGGYDEPVKWNAHNLLEQVTDLAYNWNWISLFVQPLAGKEGLEDILGINYAFHTVKDKTTVSFFNQGKWDGTLKTMKPGEMYKVRMANPLEGKTIRGTYVDPKENWLNISSGWNWIGSLSIFSLSLNEAFADLQPVKGDYVKDKEHVSFYRGYAWEGTLHSITPGKGYAYFSAASEDKAFRFPEVEPLYLANRVTLAFNDDEDAGSEDWAPFTPIDHHRFSDNMNVVATLSDGVTLVDTACVAAFIDGECRGCTRAVNGTYYITVAANAEEAGKQVTFRTYVDGEVKPIVENSKFITDAIEGNPDQPKELTIGDADGIQQADYAGIVIGPGKTNRFVHVRSQKQLKSVEVFSNVGALVLTPTSQNGQADIDLLTLPDGLYLVKAVDKAGNRTVKRVIKTNMTE
ncbi:MAG: T9SS type A sorting domain-containing protein [Prevotella sp.]|nr:T9SS type A sorting domain-containing protein [Prevotella sp.]